MAKIKGQSLRRKVPKKTRQGNGTNTKHGHKGGGTNGSPPTKLYKKRYRGQGK
jgi:hypothetical protein